jgi:hypothetical protein
MKSNAPSAGRGGRQLVETGYTWDRLAARVFEICGE